MKDSYVKICNVNDRDFNLRHMKEGDVKEGGESVDVQATFLVMYRPPLW